MSSWAPSFLERDRVRGKDAGKLGEVSGREWGGSRGSVMGRYRASGFPRLRRVATRRPTQPPALPSVNRPASWRNEIGERKLAVEVYEVSYEFGF